MQSLSLGIVAHVDAGKTSLTERLLHAAGVIDEIGRVDDGSTQTDSLPLEQQRGITIKSAVASFAVNGVTVNLIDTPGHSDFIAEVERVLSVLDGAILVVSAVEGVQAQTRVLWRALRRLDIPTLIFVNKIDRAGADTGRVITQIRERLAPTAVAVNSAVAEGSAGASVQMYDARDAAFIGDLINVLADADDAFLSRVAGGETLPAYGELCAELRRQSHQGEVHPVFVGSAITGAGLPELMSAITDLLPSVASDIHGEPAGEVFKVERGPAGERLALMRMFRGRLSVRDRVRVRAESDEKVTAISVFDHGGPVVADNLEAGQIGLVRGLSQVRIGDVIGVRRRARAGGTLFARPGLQTVIDAREPSQRGLLHSALTQLAEQDPLINLRQDETRHEIAVSLYGEVQKEVIEATLATVYGVEVTFQETTALCIERLTGSGRSSETIATQSNPFLATVGLEVEPAPVDHGVEFQLGVELGSMPPAFFTAVEESVRRTLHEGLHGWEVPDCVVTMTHSGYWARQSHSHGTFDASMSSTAGDFRNLTPLVLMEALRAAGTVVCEPMHEFELQVPSDCLGPVLGALPGVRAVPRETEMAGLDYRLVGTIPAANVHALQQRVPTLTHGEGLLETAASAFHPVTGEVPARRRTDHDPLHRREYLLRVAGKI